MCRLAAFPPGFARDRALEILLRFEGPNTDGVGAAYVKNGKFQIEKSPMSISEVLESGHNFLGHMGPECKSWTIAHLRLASHGCNHMRNTHPFIVGDYCVVHNGVWSNYSTAKGILKKVPMPDGSARKFEGETDTEVAAHLLQFVGPEDFTTELDYGGVFLALKRDGDLWACKVSGDLEVSKRKSGAFLMASTLDQNKFKNKYEAKRGCYHFDVEGKLLSATEKPGYSSTNYSNSNYSRSGWDNDDDYGYQSRGSSSMCSFPKQQTSSNPSTSTTPETTPRYTPMSLKEIEEYLEQGWKQK